MSAIATVEAPADLEAEVPAIVEWAQSLNIATPFEFQEAGERLKGIKGMMKRVTDFFTPMKRAQDEAKKRILEAERKLADPLTKAESMAKAAMLRYQRAEQEKAEAERRRLQAEADEKARREREALERKAAAAKKPETQAKYQEAAASVATPVIHVQTEALKMDGIAVRKVWKARIVDEQLVPREFLIVDTAKLDKFAKAMQGSASVPGVQFYQEEIMSARGR